MKSIASLLAILFLQSCANQGYQQFDQRVKSWVGESEDSLVAELGAPTSVYETPSGMRVLEYLNARERVAVTGYGGTEVTKFRDYCKTKYIVGDSGKIESANWEGNRCPRR